MGKQQPELDLSQTTLTKINSTYLRLVEIHIKLTVSSFHKQQSSTSLNNTMLKKVL